MKTIGVAVLMCFAFATGCSSMKKGNEAYTEYGFMKNLEYQGKKQLSEPLFKLENGSLSEKSIRNLLKSRVKIPAKVSVAVVRLNMNSSYERRPLNEQISKGFYSRKNWGKRVQAVMPVPDILVNHPVTLEGLRSTAALMRADLLLIVSPKNSVDWQLNIFEENKAKAYTNLDVLLLDTRTGAVPFTFIASEMAEIPKKNNDYSNQEMMQRAMLESEKKAYTSLLPPVQDFINTVL